MNALLTISLNYLNRIIVNNKIFTLQYVEPHFDMNEMEDKLHSLYTGEEYNNLELMITGDNLNDLISKSLRALTFFAFRIQHYEKLGHDQEFDLLMMKMRTDLAKVKFEDLCKNHVFQFIEEDDKCNRSICLNVQVPASKKQSKKKEK